MNPFRTKSQPTTLSKAPKGLEGLESLAWLMDKAIPIPGTRFRVGIDAILGLLPVGGDVLAGIVQVGIVALALYRYKVPKAVAARMGANVLLDLTLGAIPILGDVFDAFFKANTRNLALLREVQTLREADQPVPTGPSKRYLIGIVLGLVGLLLLIFGAFVWLTAWVIRRGLV
ncbi:MAG: DUF4112 domain-containing protein [Isosphaeraceae bacterium]